MRVLLITATGLLGGKLLPLLASRGFDVVPAHHSAPVPGGVAVDLADPASVASAVRSSGADAVVLSAAYTDVDKCEEEREACLKVNCLGPAAAAEAAPWLIYISTDYVFDGSRGGYSESDQPSPIQWYGLSKLCGERAAAAYARRWTILRPSTLFGLGGSKLNFAMWALRELSAGRPVRAFTDVYSSPTLADSLAEAVAEALERGIEGLWHFAGATRASRYEWAAAVAERLGLRHMVQPAASASAAWRARRPKDSSLSTARASARFKTKPLPLEEAAARFVEEAKYKGVI